MKSLLSLILLMTLTTNAFGEVPSKENEKSEAGIETIINGTKAGVKGVFNIFKTAWDFHKKHDSAGKVLDGAKTVVKFYKKDNVGARLKDGLHQINDELSTPEINGRTKSEIREVIKEMLQKQGFEPEQINVLKSATKGFLENGLLKGLANLRPNTDIVNDEVIKGYSDFYRVSFVQPTISKGTFTCNFAITSEDNGDRIILNGCNIKIITSEKYEDIID